MADRLHLDQRDVGVRIGPDHLGAQAAAVGQLDRDPVGALDHVVVGEDVTLLVDDEAGAGAAPRRLAAAPIVERIVERIGQRPGVPVAVR